jgi:hypothetical protein
VKRSEAIKLLINAVAEASEGDLELLDEEASVVLDRLLEADFKPPQIERTITEQEKSKIGLEDTEDYIVFSYEWEPELSDKGGA